MYVYKKKVKQILSFLLCMVLLVATLPMQTDAAVNPLKYIYAKQQVFVPSLGETTTITWNLQNKHPIKIYVTYGGEMIHCLVEKEEFKGGYVPHETVWDGTDSNGNAVPAGTYQVVVEPQDKYIKHKSITEVYVVDDLTQDINMLPNLEGNSYVIYGNAGKTKGVNSVSLSITENGKNIADIFTAEVQVSDHIWYARVPMSAYKLYRYQATLTGSTTGTKSLSAIRLVIE